MSTHNLCFEQIYEKYKSFLCENFQFLEVKFSIYLNRRVFVMAALAGYLITGFRSSVCVLFAKTTIKIFILEYKMRYL